MSNHLTPKQAFLKGIFDLIRAKGCYRQCKKHAATNIIQTLHKLALFRSKQTLNKFKSRGLTSRMGYRRTQSILRLFYFLEYKLYKNKKETFSRITKHGKLKSLERALNTSIVISLPDKSKNQQLQALSNPKLIAAMKIINMFRKLSLYNHQIIRPFRKWQLEDLRNLVNGYEGHNCMLYLSLRKLSVMSIVKLIDCARRRILQDCILEIYRSTTTLQEREALKLMKLGNILMKKKVYNETMTMNLSIIVTFKKFFKSLAEAKATEERKEVDYTKALNTLCFYWKQNLACNFRQFYVRSKESGKPISNGQMNTHPNRTETYLRGKIMSLIMKNAGKVIDRAILRRKRGIFFLLIRERYGEIRRSKTCAIRMILGIRKKQEIKAKQNYMDLYLAFQKFKNNPRKDDYNEEDIELKQEAFLAMAQTIKYAMQNHLRSSFLMIKGYARLYLLLEKKQEQEAEVHSNQQSDLLVEKNIIRNQSLIASYFERRMAEIDNQLLVQKRQVLLKKILIKHCMEVYEIKKNTFYHLYNLSHWRLSAKIRLLAYEKELRAEINQLNSKLEQLMNEKELFPRKDPGMEYLEFHEKQNTELRMKMMELEEMMRKKKGRGNIYSP